MIFWLHSNNKFFFQIFDNLNYWSNTDWTHTFSTYRRTRSGTIFSCPWPPTTMFDSRNRPSNINPKELALVYWESYEEEGLWNMINIVEPRFNGKFLMHNWGFLGRALGCCQVLCQLQLTSEFSKCEWWYERHKRFKLATSGFQTVGF